MTNQATTNLESTNTEHQDSIKAAAKRMCASLGAKGHKVTHTAMLEAIAEGLGLDNWRTLKAVIDAPRAKPEPEVPALPPLGEWQRWIVDGIYVDNDQQYGDEFDGRTPLEGAINALMDRLTDCGNVINICEVQDANRVSRLSPCYITEIQLDRNDTALRALYREALRLHTEKSPEARTAEATLALTWLHAQVDGLVENPKPPRGQADKDQFESLTDYYEEEQRAKAKGFGAPAEYIKPGTTLTATQALELLCTEVEESYGGVVRMEDKGEADKKLLDLTQQMYQIRAMCGYFEALLNDPDYGFDALEWEDSQAAQA